MTAKSNVVRRFLAAVALVTVTCILGGCSTPQTNSGIVSTIPTTAPSNTPTAPKPLTLADFNGHVLLAQRANGDCVSLKGKVAVTAIFVDDATCTWTQDGIDAVKAAVAEDVSSLCESAAAYGAALELSVDCRTVTVTETLARDSYADWANAALAALSLPTDGTVNAALKKELGADEAAVIFFTNQSGESFARCQKDTSFGEYAVLYGSADDFKRQLCRLFGAVDYSYPRDVLISSYQHFPDSFMNRLGDNMDDMTACLIGWTDALSEPTVSFLQGTAHVKSAQIEEEAKLNGDMTDYRLPSGDVVTGQVINGQPNGTCDVTFHNGDKYVGDYTYGARNGNGTMTYANGEQYVGEWHNDHCEGNGVFTWVDGGQYDGEWQNDSFHGNGTMYYVNGDKYVGEWQNNQRHGQGTITYVSGDTYVGQWQNDCREGEGTMTYTNGEQYVGQWSADSCNGKGVFTWSDGGRYDGEWQNGQFHGEGTMYYVGGDKYVGEWQNSRRHGEGTLYKANGDTLTGQWSEDALIQ